MKHKEWHGPARKCRPWYSWAQQLYLLEKMHHSPVKNPPATPVFQHLLTQGCHCRATHYAQMPPLLIKCYSFVHILYACRDEFSHVHKNEIVLNELEEKYNKIKGKPWLMSLSSLLLWFNMSISLHCTDLRGRSMPSSGCSSVSGTTLCSTYAVFSYFASLLVETSDACGGVTWWWDGIAVLLHPFHLRKMKEKQWTDDCCALYIFIYFSLQLYTLFSFGTAVHGQTKKLN